jgi:ABC-type transport system involved in multi-copper enzyme maturation permease subunit
MTTTPETLSTQVRRHQVWTIARNEIRRSLFSRRSLAVYLLVGMPLALMLLRALFMPDSVRASATHATTEFAEVFHFFLLRFVVFFANAMIFVRLFRGEILEKSLHYTLLAPLNRAVLVIGKYVGGVLSATLVLIFTTVSTYVLIYLPHGAAGIQLMLSGKGVTNLASYSLIVVLACCAYGALFMVAGLYFKNPMVPAVLFLGWETLTPFLPTFLKALSFVHYLVSFAPVPVSLGAFALLARPVPYWIALFALLLSSVALVWIASRAARRLEVTYSAD